MRGIFIRSIYFISIVVLMLVLFFLFIKKENRKRQFSLLPEFSYIEVYGGKKSTINLPHLDGYAVILFNPSCEACQMEAQDISNNIKSLGNYCLLFLSPDSLRKIEAFMIDYQLYDKENVLYGQINLDTIDAKFGKSTIPWYFIFNENRKLVKSALFVSAEEFDNYMSK